MRDRRSQIAITERLHRRDNGFDSGGHVAHQQDRGANSDDNRQQQRYQNHLDGIAKALSCLDTCRIGTPVIQCDILLQRLVAMDTGQRRLRMQYLGLLVLVLAGQRQDLLYPGQIFGPGGAELVVKRALFR